MKEKFYQFIFKKILHFNRYNENGCGAGWYECFTIDRKAYEWIKRNKPTRTYWLTTNIYNLKFHNKLSSYKDIRFGVSNIKQRLTRTGRLVVRFKIEMFEEKTLVCSANIQFLEAK
jgi:hypothetical protein